MAEAGFSDDGKYFSSITPDGRLRVWDTETNTLKQEYTPDLHLTSPPSCLQHISVHHSATPKQKGGKRASIPSGEETQCIALGTTSGKILIYSIAQAKVETVLVPEKDVDNQPSKVTALDWSKKYGLYSCNKESNVFEWELQSGAVRNKYNINVESNSKQGNIVSAIKVVPYLKSTVARFIVAASSQIRLWRLHNKDACLIKSFGHNTAQLALLSLVSLNESCWLIEGSQNERLLSFWDVTITEDSLPQQNGDEPTPTKRQRRKSVGKAPVLNTPMYSFVLEDAPRMVDALLKEEQGVELKLAATTRSGVVHYYGHMLNGSSVKPIKPSVTIQVSSADARPLPLQCCRLQSGGDLVLGYAQEPALVFEKVTPDLKTKTQVIIKGEAKEGKKKVKKTNEVNKVRADLSASEVTYVQPMGGVDRKRTAPGGQVEVPMEARLQNLALDVSSRRKMAVSENLTKLLVQGLHSKDKSIILTVLQQDNIRVAESTVANLPADYVPLLLEQLVEMASKKTSQCSSAVTWCGALVRRHAALLLAGLGAQHHQHLAHLLAIFTHRRSHLCQLLNLKGRIDLTTRQRNASQTPQEEQEAVLEYKDTSSDEEMEVEQYQSDSAPSWNESEDDASEEHDSDGD